MFLDQVLASNLLNLFGCYRFDFLHVIIVCLPAEPNCFQNADFHPLVEAGILLEYRRRKHLRPHTRHFFFAGEVIFDVVHLCDQCRFDVVHFNNGMHGWGYSEEEYGQQFPALVATIRKHAPKAKLIWAMTTPVRTKGDLSQLADRTDRVQARNRIALAIVTKEGIAVNDLFALVKDHPEYWREDGVHFNGKGTAAQAEQVSQRVLEAM